MKKDVLIGIFILITMSTVVACGDVDTESNAGIEGKSESRNVGEAFSFNDWEITLDSFEFDQKVSDGRLQSTANDGSKFLILNFTATNNGSKEASFTSMMGGLDINVIFNEKYEYGYTITMVDGDMSESISPLDTKSGFVVIEMPDKVVESEESLILSIEEESSLTRIQLR